MSAKNLPFASSLKLLLLNFLTEYHHRSFCLPRKHLGISKDACLSLPVFQFHPITSTLSVLLIPNFINLPNIFTVFSLPVICIRLFSIL